jgi:esterase/lipase superfamily enzyme
MNKAKERWRSERLHRDVTMCRWGHAGQPVLLFPTAGGDAEEPERWQMMQVLQPLIDGGKIRIYTCDSVAGRALVEREGSPKHRMWLQNEFHQYVKHEVVPAIRTDTKNPQAEIWTVGMSFGAFHAVAVLCRFPDIFTKAAGISGTYDLKRFFEGAQPHDFDEYYFVSTPLEFVPTLAGRHLDVLRTRFIQLTSGEGRAEDIGETWRLANVLGRMGVPNHVDSWGKDWPHDWATWRKMVPQLLNQWTGGMK